MHVLDSQLRVQECNQTEQRYVDSNLSTRMSEIQERKNLIFYKNLCQLTEAFKVCLKLKMSLFVPGSFMQIFKISCLVCVSLLLIGLSRAYQPQVGRSGTLQSLRILQHDCTSRTSISKSIWVFFFKWIFGVVLPMLGVLWSAAYLKLRHWPQCSSALKNYIQLCASVSIVDLTLQLPAFFLDVSKMMTSAEDKTPEMSFIVHVFSGTIPKLQFSIVPLAILTILPWKQPSPLPFKVADEDLRLLPEKSTKSNTAVES